VTASVTKQIAIVPAGVWGTALALPASAGGHQVWLWRPEPEWAATWDGGHPKLPGLKLGPNVRATAEIAEAVSGADLVILAPATVILREVCQRLRPHLRPEAVIVAVAKGLEPETFLRVSEVIAQEIPSHAGRIATLSGPNFAHEVAAGLPTGTVVAAPDEAIAGFAQDLLMSPRFRIYTNTDQVGVELAGALKNVIALGTGISDGLGLGDNARASLITRGLTEIARLGVAMGANMMTFAGLAGMGDLVLTCTGDSSRNRQAGLAIGRGESPEEFLQETGYTVEGIRTAKAVKAMAERYGIQMPISEAIYRVIYEGAAPLPIMEALMTREKKAEYAESGL
jgi:glycerol-3-phosphate dehydrogenase (NAD(P)+)